MVEPVAPVPDPWTRTPGTDDRPDVAAPRRRKPSPARAAFVVGLAYAMCTGAVVCLDYSSETAKLDHGVYTDTFPPLLLAEGVTLPISSLLPQPLYPDLTSDEHGVVHISVRDRAAVTTRVRSDLTAITVQAPLVALAAAAAAALRRRRALAQERVSHESHS